MSPATITRDEMAHWSRYIHELCGLHLDENKGYLIETRLGALMREMGAGTFTELLTKSRGDSSGSARKKIINAITTHETSFFRDTAPFDLLRHKVIPDLIDRRSRGNGSRITLRIWSAACSTGQEAYSTGIVFKELLGDLSNYDIRILGTDISDTAVAQASYAHYNRLEIERGLPPEMLKRHFVPVGDQWKVRDEIRALATFRTLNLMEPFTFPAPFDIIFCRNVAIYFTETDRLRLFRNISRCLARDGCLMIGATESITTLCPEFEPKRYLRSLYYQFKDGA